MHTLQLRGREEKSFISRLNKFSLLRETLQTVCSIFGWAELN